MLGGEDGETTINFNFVYFFFPFAFLNSPPPQKSNSRGNPKTLQPKLEGLWFLNPKLQRTYK
jgi:hypothetical protein